MLKIAFRELTIGIFDMMADISQQLLPGPIFALIELDLLICFENQRTALVVHIFSNLFI